MTASEVDTADIRRDAVGEFAQHFIAHIVAMRIVHGLEVVDIHDEERDRLGRRIALFISVSRWLDM